MKHVEDAKQRVIDAVKTSYVEVEREEAENETLAIRSQSYTAELFEKRPKKGLFEHSFMSPVFLFFMAAFGVCLVAAMLIFIPIDKMPLFDAYSVVIGVLMTALVTYLAVQQLRTAMGDLKRYKETGFYSERTLSLFLETVTPVVMIGKNALLYGRLERGKVVVSTIWLDRISKIEVKWNSEMGAIYQKRTHLEIIDTSGNKVATLKDPDAFVAAARNIIEFDVIKRLYGRIAEGRSSGPAKHPSLGLSEGPFFPLVF